MGTSATLESRDAVGLLSAGTGSTYQLVRRLAGGETGAHAEDLLSA